jgi:hypothetical protein
VIAVEEGAIPSGIALDLLLKKEKEKRKKNCVVPEQLLAVKPPQTNCLILDGGS